MNLQDKYEIDTTDKYWASMVRLVRGTAKPPQIVFKRSMKKYGAKDNLGRYYIDKYSDIEVGKYTWGYWFMRSSFVKSIGAFCSIAGGQSIVPNKHRMDYVSTWDTLIQYEELPPLEKSITIGNDVWIGANCTFFNNVKIGDGAVIATGSIIRKDVPPYAVVGGVDKLLKYRFSEDVIKELLRMQWWNWDDEKIKESFALFPKPEKFIEKYR